MLICRSKTSLGRARIIFSDSMVADGLKEGFTGFQLFKSAAPYSSPDLCSTVFDLVRTLPDVKIFACGEPYKQFSALKGVLRPVEARAKKVHSQYLARARVLDRKIHHTASGVVGPIEAKFLEFGAPGVEHAHEERPRLQQKTLLG